MAIHYVDLGITAPPTTIGPYPMTPFANDTRPDGPGNTVTTIPAPRGGVLTFSASHIHYKIGTPPAKWETWSHGYTGDVYWSSPTGYTSTLILPANTGCIYFYAQPEVFAVQILRATADGVVTSGNIPVDGVAGAHGFAFYADPGESISQIVVFWNVPDGLDSGAVGEFAIGLVIVPGSRPSTALLFPPSVALPPPTIPSTGQLFPPLVSAVGEPGDVCVNGTFAVDTVTPPLGGLVARRSRC